MTTYRVTLAPSGGASKVLTIAQPSLRVTISKGGGAVLPSEKTFGAAKVYGSLVSGYASNGLPNTDTQAAIDYALAQGYPAWSIIWMYQGEAVAGTVSATASVPAFFASASFTPPPVTALVLGEAVTASITSPAFAALAAFMSPTVAAQQVATGTVVQFSAMATFVPPTVTAQQFATASVPQFAASAAFAAPSVTVTPAGATAASATVPSFGAVATFAAPSVTAQGAATASVPSFSALATLSAASITGQRMATAAIPQFSAIASLSAPSVTGVVQTLATVIVPQFAATSTFASPAVTGQKAATAAVPSFFATSTLTVPSVAATRVATASVPSFGATAAFATPTVTGVQQAAAVSATATVPSLTATATLTPPTVTAKRVATASVPSFAATATFAAPSATGVQMSAAPTQPVISATGGDTTVTIAKTSGGTGATSWKIMWGTAAGSRANEITWATLQAANFPATAYTHTGRTNGTTYYYSLVATNAQGSTESAEVSAEAAAVAKVTVSDNFNRANGGLGSNWTTAAGMNAPSIVNNLAGGGANIGAYWSADTFADRQWAKMQIIPYTFAYQTDALETPTGGPMVRVNGNAGYFPSFNNYDDGEGNVGFLASLWKRTGSTYTRFTTGGAGAPLYESFTPDEYSWVKITADGSAIKVFGSTSENGTYIELISVTDSTTASGAAGFARPSSNGLDNWSAGDL